jgi:hypothetical protein
MPQNPRRILADSTRDLEWRRSAKGNQYTRLADGTTVTVFRRKDGETFAYCVHTEDDGAWFSEDSWDTEAEALAMASAMIEERREIE